MMEYYEAMMDASEASLQTFHEPPLGEGSDDDDDYRGGCLLDINGNQRQTVVKFPSDKEELAVIMTTNNEIMNREDLTEEDRQQLYYKAEDYVELKSQARMDSLGCERDGTSKLLDNIFVEKCKTSQESLFQWVGSLDTVVEGGGERRGLERMANNTQSNLRQQAQFHAVMEVLRAQDELLEGRFITDPEEVRRVSLKATRVARHFARMIAKADALAVHADMNETTAKRVKSGSSSSKREKAAGDLPPPASPKGHKDKKDKAAKKKDKESKKEKDHHHHHHHDKKEKKEKVKEKKDKENTELGGGKDKAKPKSFLKQKYKDTKAGIVSRMQRAS